MSRNASGASKEHATIYLKQCDGVELLSALDLEAIPPFHYAHEHFGYRDRLSQPVIEGTGSGPDTRLWPSRSKQANFFLAILTKKVLLPDCRSRKFFLATGSYVAYLRMEEHVGAFRDFLRAHGETPEQQELVAAKLMGRWRSGAPLVLVPHRDDPKLGADSQRSNDFNYAKMDPHGYGCPLGAHIRRMNPRDTAVNMNRRKMIRRGGTYGPPLPEGVPDDGIERGIAAFVGCASLVRQFEFAMNVWANDPNFHELENERDPIFGTQDGTFDMTIPKRPIRKKIKGLPAFTTIRGGAYFFLPGIRALRYLAGGLP